MADYAVTDTQLTNIANAIRTKGGTASQLVFPTGFISAINDISGGGGQGETNYLNYAKRLGNIFTGADNLPSKIELSPIALASGNNNGDFLNGAGNSSTELVVNFTQVTNFSLSKFLFNTYIGSVKITGNLNLCTSYMNMFNNANALRTIDAVFDFTSATGNDACKMNTSNGGNAYVQNMRFVANTCLKTLNLQGFSALNEATLISAANCLVAGASGQSLILHAAPQALCSTIMGNNDNGAFVADENGTMTLADFIANVKGWTLA